MRFLSKYRELILTIEPATWEKKGRRIRFENGQYVTSDKKEIEFIRKNAGFGSYITEAPEEAPCPPTS